MKATQVQIRNFRLLEKADIALDEATTMVVGRNNSGKTSVVEIFRKLTKVDRSPFAFDDLSLNAHARFNVALNAYDEMLVANEGDDTEAADAARLRVNDLPAIELTLTIQYSKDIATRPEEIDE